MPILYLLRHIKSQWNADDRFAGWTDGPLDENELYDAKFLADKTINKQNIDKIYCSALFRNMDTVARMFNYGNKRYPLFVHLDGGKMQKWGKYANAGENEFQIFVTEKFNERCYGKLQGLNKQETIKKYGQQRVRLWRRSYDVAPPGGESLKGVFKRAVPFYKKYIERDLKNGKNVLIVASHNPLRALAKYVEKIPDKKIIDFEIPYAGLIKYDFDESLNLQKKALM